MRSFTITAAKDKGIQRAGKAPNEDYYSISNGMIRFNGKLLPYTIVGMADGHGMNGAAASHLAVHAAFSSIHFYLNTMGCTPLTLPVFLGAGFATANKTVIDKLKEGNWQSGNTGATLDVLLLMPERYAIAHLGDARIYVCKEQTLERLTHDHIQYLVDDLPSPMPYNLSLYHANDTTPPNAIGQDAEVTPQIITGTYAGIKSFLLATDGVHKSVHEDELFTSLQQLQPTDAIIERARNPRKVIEEIQAITEAKGLAFDQEKTYKKIAGQDHATAVLVTLEDNTCF